MSKLKTNQLTFGHILVLCCPNVCAQICEPSHEIQNAPSAGIRSSCSARIFFELSLNVSHNKIHFTQNIYRIFNKSWAIGMSKIQLGFGQKNIQYLFVFRVFIIKSYLILQIRLVWFLPLLWPQLTETQTQQPRPFQISCECLNNKLALKSR